MNGYLCGWCLEFNTYCAQSALDGSSYCAEHELERTAQLERTAATYTPGAQLATIARARSTYERAADAYWTPAAPRSALLTELDADNALDAAHALIEALETALDVRGHDIGRTVHQH